MAKFTVTIVDKGNSFLYKIERNDSYVSLLNVNPFFNCQTFCIAGFDQIIGDYDGDLYATDEQIISLLRYINQNVINKPQLMVDVYHEHRERIKKLFPTIIFQTDYVNNTGSHMSVFLLNISEL